MDEKLPLPALHASKYPMASAAPVRHRRVYQACEPCRLKKIRCDLGSVDHPTRYPCVRCRREDRECYFAASRNRKVAAAQEPIRGNKRRATSPESEGVPRRIRPAREDDGDASTSRTSRQSQASIEPRLSPQASPFAENARAAAALLRGHPRTYHDALTLLSEACEHSDHLNAPEPGPSRRNNAGPRRDENASTHARGSPAAANRPQKPEETLRALKAWSNLRFVRGGLFTAEEALDMIDYFYSFLAPFSPVVPECYKKHSQHEMLIEDEPILTVTMLMIGSRYRTWTGPAAIARSYIVHDRLWRYLQGMVSRLFWSEDNFVGEFTSLSDYYESSSSSSLHYSLPGNWSNGFRTLGTCEALLILLDWHPRSLHFPPIDEDTTSIMLREAKKPDQLRGSGPQSGHDWLARSDRLGRSMLSTASMLATEIGVFDESQLSVSQEGGHNVREIPSERLRIYRLRQLIWVYATQQPGRPGWRVLTQSPLRPGSGSPKDDNTECWYRVSTLMRQANELLFISHRHTNEIIRSGEYLNILQTFRPLIQKFGAQFDQARPIEYAYVRLCIYSVALQAVINRRYYDGGRHAEAITQEEEEEHLAQTVSAAQRILRTALDELIPDSYFRYIPVRSYSRILGAALFLLKACAAGVTEIDIPTSLRLISGIAAGFRTHTIDETSMTTRWGELLDRLSSGLQPRLHTASTQRSSAQPHDLGAGSAGVGVSEIQPPERPVYPNLSTLPTSTMIPPQAPPPGMQTTSTPDVPVVPHPEVSDIYHNANLNTNGEAFAMWWDLLCPSQAVSFNDVPWYPALGMVDGNEGVFHEGGIPQAPPGLPEQPYE